MSLIYLLNKEDVVTIDDNYETIVLLSPSLYWVKTCEIPTKNRMKAKNIASHMMSDRPESFKEIFIFKKDKLYNAYAYDKILLNEKLKNLNTDNYKVYFANQLNINETIKLNDTYCINKYETSIIELKNSKNTNNHPTLKDNYIKLLENEKPFISSQNNEVKSSIVFKITAVLFLIYLILFSINKSNELTNIDKQINSLNKEEISIYQIKSLMTKYENLDTKLTSMRKELKETLTNQDIKKIIYDGNNLKVEK